MPSERQQQKRLARQQGAEQRKALVAQQAGPSSKRVVSDAAAAPIAIDELPFRWSASSLDLEYCGEWDWNLQGREAGHLLTVLEQMTGKTWREVKALETNSSRRTRRLHHAQPVSSICPDAQRRLEALELSLEEVFRLRYGNMLRVWGYVQAGVFHLLWFDRNHRVCPVDE